MPTVVTGWISRLYSPLSADVDAQVAVDHDAWEFIAPLHERNAVGFDRLVKTDVLELFDGIEPVQIEMVQGDVAVRVREQNVERRAHDLFIDVKSFGDTLDELRFARTKVAREQHDVPWMQVRRQR